MSLNKFVPLSPDPYITSDPEMTLAKFGHLNTIVDYLNGTNALTNIKIAGINNTAGYIDFSANPTGSTTVVGAIRTYVNGVNLSEVMEFREDGNIKVGGILSVGNYANSTGFGQKIRIIGQGDASLGIYRNQESTFAAKLEFMKSRGTYDVPLIVNSSDILGSISFFGYNGTSYISAAYIQSVVLSTSTGVEGDLRFIVFNNTGSNFNPMRITKEGVGIGNALDYIPTATLQVRGSGSTSATTSLLVQNSSGTNLISTTDDGETKISGVTKVGLNTGAVVPNAGFIGTAAHHYFYVKSNSNVDGEIGFKRNSGEDGIYTLQFDNAQAYIRYDRPAQTMATRCQFFITYITQGVERGRWQDTGEFSINTITKVPSSICTIESTNKGFLKPRLTTAQKNAIVTPAAGLEIYDTDLNRPCFYNGSAWVTL